MRRIVLASALLLLGSGCSSGAPTDAAPEQDPRPGPVVGGDPMRHCGDPAAQASSLPVPQGADSARICEDERGSFHWQPPQDLLTDDVDGLVQVIAAQAPVTNAVRNCTMQGGTAFDLRLEYPDGEVRSVFGDTGGCGELEVGGEPYEGADEVLAAFLDRIRNQRVAAEASYRRVRLGCGDDEQGPRLSLVGDPRLLVRAISCWRPNADELGRFRSTVVVRRELRVLLTDLHGRTVRKSSFEQPACRTSDRYYFQDIIGQTAWGDVVAIRGVCHEFMVESRTYWRAGPPAREVLDRLRLRSD